MKTSLGFCLALGAAAAVTTIGASAAWAFPYGYSWLRSAIDGPPAGKPGAGGIYYTGGASDHGLACSSCHIKAESKVDASISAVPAWAKVGGGDAYKPGTMYTITVKLVGEHLLGTGNGTTNGMTATFEDASGKLAGVLGSDNGASGAACPQTYPKMSPGGTTYVYGDCRAVTSLGSEFVKSANSWTFTWKAPAAGKGEVTLFYGVVDGDTLSESYLDDDVKEGKKKLVEAP